MVDSQDFIMTPHPCEDCVGYCCERFTTGYSYEVLRRMYKRWRKHGTSILKDIHLVFPMIRVVDCVDGHVYFRCIHHDDVDGCGIYEIRPEMCRDYEAQRCHFLKRE